MVLITVTGPPGSGKTTACRTLMIRTGLTYIYAGQLFRDRAKELGLSLEAFGTLCEKDPRFDMELDERMLMIARKGDAILEGRMIGALCWKENIPSLKVFVDADIKVRATRIMEREGGDLGTVLREISERERSEMRRYMTLYGMDYRDRSMYDLWVDSTSLTQEQVVERIMKGAGV